MNKPLLPDPAGVDVSKDTLQLHLRGRQYLLPNTPAGYAQLLKLVQAGGAVQLICEATGGYEQGLVAACHVAGQLISVVNPARVRHLALAQGQAPQTAAAASASPVSHQRGHEDIDPSRADNGDTHGGSLS